MTPRSDPPTGRILVVEDRDSLRRLMRRALAAQGHQVTAVATRKEAEETLETEAFDLVLSDLRLPDGSGVDVLRTLRCGEQEAGDAPIPFVILTAFGDVSSAVEAMKLGASDFLEKPLEIDELSDLANRLLATASTFSSAPDGEVRGVDSQGRGGSSAAPANIELARDAVFQVDGGPQIIGSHPSLRAAQKLLRRVAPSGGTVLLLGESGTGKELFARSLHALSPRAQGAFVALNCAAVPEALLESELFGHERGAFTGAAARRVGRFEQAEGGTLFLDEIGELELAVQAKLLRVLEERTFERVGGSLTLEADVRVVAATNVELRQRVEEGAFRADLYYRLEVFPIRVPPLRERSSDVPLLAVFLLTRACRRNGLSTPRLSGDAGLLLQRQEWPGNVRELANVMERAAMLCEGEELDEPQIREALQRTSGRPLGGVEPVGVRGGASASRTEVDDSERAEVERALLASNGDKRAAAQSLGVSYRTLQRRIVRYDLEGYPHYRDAPRVDG